MYTRQLKIVVLSGLVGVSLMAAYEVAKQCSRPSVTSTTYETCKDAAPDGKQSGCGPATSSNATKITVRRGAG